MNIREEVLALLDRVHTMWSITNADYDNQYGYIHRLAPGSQVPQSDPSPPAAVIAAGIPAPWSFRPTIDAITRTRQLHLAGPVITRYMAIPATDSVGQGSRNVREDVLAVMTRLNFILPYAGFAAEKATVSAMPAGSRVPDSSLTATLPVISRFKVGLASASLSIDPLHADEREYDGADRLVGQTSIVNGDTLRVTPRGGSAASFTKHFAVFIPRGAPPERNDVHLFFTPYLQPIEFVAEQGLRAQHDGAGWILIAVPGAATAATDGLGGQPAKASKMAARQVRGTTIGPRELQPGAHSRRP